MKKYICLVISTLFAITSSFACTDFRLKAQDGTVLISRSMEFAADMRSNLMSMPRGHTFTNTTSDGKPGLTWKNTYGYVFLDGFDTGLALDGMNEMGLAVEALYLPGETQYQTIPAGKNDRAIAYLNFGNWVLGNFKSIAEVKLALPTIYVYAQTIPQAGTMIFPLHFAITDATGTGIIVEFVNGNMNVYDNQIGVLTNSPIYPWQVTNIRNYVNLTPLTPTPVIDSGMTFAATGQGAGMLGLPGDISPPSRFVKITTLLRTVLTPKTSVDALNLAQHIINNVDIPLGFVRESQNINTATNELTQWVVFKDLTHRQFYYRTYGDLSLHLVDLTKVNLAENAPQYKMPIASPQYVLDMTQRFTGPK